MGNTGAEILHERTVFMQRMSRPSPSEFLWYSLTKARSTEGDHRQRNRSPLGDFAVGAFQFDGRSKKTRVVISNAKIHCVTYLPNSRSKRFVPIIVICRSSDRRPSNLGESFPCHHNRRRTQVIKRPE